MRVGDSSPWGKIDCVYPVNVEGGTLYSVGTPSHGGIFVPNELLHKIPEKERKFAAMWGGTENWYEEDICAISVILSFPGAFKVGETSEKMRETLDECLSRYEL